MKLFRRLLLTIIIILLGYYVYEHKLISLERWNHFKLNFQQDTERDKPNLKQKTRYYDLAGDLYQWLGKEEEDLQNSFGEPIRKDQSAYGYQWSIYANDTGQYIQFGLSNGKVVTLFAIGEEIEIDPVEIGMTYNEVKQHFELKNEVSFNRKLYNYTFKLNENDLMMRPLVQLEDDVFLQLYFDTFTEKLMAIRLLDADILLRQLPYEVLYQGDLPSQKSLSEAEWREIEIGMEEQIFDISNIIRYMYDAPQLEWDDAVSEVAYMHSKDMSEHNYFSHNRPDGSGLKERLLQQNIYYQSAGENIAAQYVDAPDATFGWLNSEGHRKALLNKQFSHLGVGVFEKYYTQNFIAK